MLKTRYQNDECIEAGVDEVGRGCLWGPLVTGAVIWLPESEWSDDIRAVAEEIKDSKKLTDKKRKKLAHKIKEYALDTSVGIVEPHEIDEFGMSLSNQTAFARAVSNLTVEPDRLLVDGILPLQSKDWTKEQHTIIDGDAQYLSIAAASIVAKVHRDTWVEEWCATNKELADRYGLLSSKGYGTAVHRNAVKQYGPQELHRRLFLRKILGFEIYNRPEKPSLKNQCQIQDE